MNLFDLQPTDETSELVIRHPATGDPLAGADGEPIVFRIFGPDSPRVRNARRAVQDRRFEALANNPAGARLPTATLEAYGREDTALMVAGWSQNFTTGGEPVKHSLDECARLFERLPWLHDQVARFVADRGKFYRD